MNKLRKSKKLHLALVVPVLLTLALILLPASGKVLRDTNPSTPTRTVLSADGPMFPPNPWERADCPMFPPNPWERC